VIRFNSSIESKKGEEERRSARAVKSSHPTPRKPSGESERKEPKKNEIQPRPNTTRDEIKKHANSIVTRPNVFHLHFDDESSSARRSHPSFTRRFSKG